MRNTIVGFILVICIGFYTCREDFDFETATQSLSFSNDTISIDTVFTNFNSETFVVRVYNNQDEDVFIPRIYLGRGANSYYRLNVDGVPGYDFADIPIRGNDSIFVFVDMAIPETTTQQYEDDIFFETNESQNVKLISWIEETTYYLPEEGSNEVEITESSWDNSTVKFISGTAKVVNDLTIEAGTKIYFFTGSGLEVESGNTLTVNGSLNEKVIFRSHRHTPRNDSLPDQWNKIVLKENAIGNLNYTKIIGGSTGLETESGVNLNIQNTEVYNNQDYGLRFVNSIVSAENVVVNNSNLASVSLESGSYEFNQCTIANYFDLDAGATVSVFLSNTNNDIANPLNVFFSNSILYGRASNAILLNQNMAATYNYTFESCVIRNNNTSVLDIGTDTNFMNSITDDPLFVNVDFGVNNLRLQEDSSARGVANQTFANQTPVDIDGNSRTVNPTIGAYQN